MFLPPINDFTNGTLKYLQHASELGYFNIMVPRTPNESQFKWADRVDQTMIDFIRRQVEFTLLTHVILASSDGDFEIVANYVRDKGLQFHVIGYRDVSRRLIESATAVTSIKFPTKIGHTVNDSHQNKLSDKHGKPRSRRRH